MMKKWIAFLPLFLPFAAYSADETVPAEAPVPQAGHKVFPLTGIHAQRLPIKPPAMPRPDTIDATRNLSGHDRPVGPVVLPEPARKQVNVE